MNSIICKETKITGLSAIPFVLVFCFIISSLGVGLAFQFLLVFLLFMGYFFIDKLTVSYNFVILLFFIFFSWSFLLFIVGNASEKVDHYLSIPIAFYFILFSYFYGLKTGRLRIKYYIYSFIVLYFVLSILEIKYDFILPSSGKYKNVEYQKSFEGIPVTTFANANDFSSAMGVYFIYIYSYCSLQKNRFRFIFLFFALIIIVLANSRGILLTVLLTPLVYSLYNKKAIAKTFCLYLILLTVVLLLISLFNVSVFYLNKYFAVFSNIKEGNMDSSSLYRLNIIIYTLTNLNQLLVGFGPNGSSIFLKDFYIPNPHNFFLEVLIDYGFIGLTLVVLVFCTCFKLNITVSKSEVPEYLKSSCRAVNILFFLYIFISVVSSSFLNYWPFCWFPVYLTMMHAGIFKRLKFLQ